MFFYNSDKLGVAQVETPDQMPSEEHWAIIVFETTSIHVPGDERSRTAPGHGYPAHTDVRKSFRYWACDSKQALEGALDFMRTEHAREAGFRAPQPYVVIFACKAEVRTKVEVEIT